MIQVIPIRDLAWLDGLVKEFYGPVSNDLCPPVEQFTLGKLVQNPQNVFLQVLLDGQPVGAFMFFWRPPATLDVHTILTPFCRGAAALRASRAALKYIFTHTTCQKITSFAPEDNRPALMFALANGFKITGKAQNFPKGGRNIWVTYVALNKSDWKEALCQ